MIAAAPEETLIAAVSTKSTIRAPIGTNAQASPKARPDAAAALGEAGDELAVVQHDHGDHEHHEAHRRQEQSEAAAPVLQCPERGLDRVSHRGDRVGHDRQREGD